jgi:uroporphyrinogen-III synthase
VAPLNAPLTGKRIVVTRPVHQVAALRNRLEDAGAHAIVLPTVAIERIFPNQPLQHAIETLSGYDWIVFTSVNGVDIFIDEVDKRGAEAPLVGPRIAAIGPVTARALTASGIRVDVMPQRFVAEEIVEALGDVRGRRILLPRAARARRMLSDALRDLGAHVTDVPLYETTVPETDPNVLAEIERGVDAVTFTSSSTVENFVAIAAERATEMMRGAVVACIGPITAQTARSLGLRVDVVATRYTTEGLVTALVEFFESGSGADHNGAGDSRWN